MITDQDMRDFVTRSLGDDAADFDVPAIVDDLQSGFGTVDPETIPDDDYWQAVRRHGATAGD